MTDTDNRVASTSVTDADVPDWPMPRAADRPLDPPPALLQLQADKPVTRVRWWDGTTPWVVTGYHNQRSVLADPRMSADSSKPNYPNFSAGHREKDTSAPSTFIKLDDPEHARLRRMVTAPFSVKRSETRRPAIQKIVDGLIDGILAGPKPVDLVDAFALAVPSLVICDVLGVPYSDHDFFQEAGKQVNSRNSTAEQATAASQQLYDYMDRMVGEKLTRPGDDDVMSLVAQQVKAGQLSRHGAAEMGRLLLVAGHETTANMIALGTLALLEHPDQLAILRETDDPVVVAGAVEELLRYLTIVFNWRARTAVADIEIGGQVIRAGDGVVVPIEAANRDPEVFPDPDRLDLRRGERNHMAFFFGPHQCLGQNLARVELEVVYSTLYRRIPTLRLAVGLDELAFKSDAIIYGVYGLPVTW